MGDYFCLCPLVRGFIFGEEEQGGSDVVGSCGLIWWRGKGAGVKIVIQNRIKEVGWWMKARNKERGIDRGEDFI